MDGLMNRWTDGAIFICLSKFLRGYKNKYLLTINSYFFFFIKFNTLLILEYSIHLLRQTEIVVFCSSDKYKYSRISMAQILMNYLPCLARTRSWIPIFPYMRLLWSNFYIPICFSCWLFSFSLLVTGSH